MIRVAFILLAILGNLPGDEAFLSGEIPARPAEGIYDPDQWLTSGARVEMVQNIEIAKDKWGAEVFVIILPQRPQEEGDQFARRVAEQWGSGNLWGVILHVIGDPESPMFFGDRKKETGWSESQELEFDRSVKRALEDVEGRAMREEDQRLQVQTGTRELTDELGYLGLIQSRINMRYTKARSDFVQVKRVEQTNKIFLRRLLMVGIPLALLLIACLAYFLYRRGKERRNNFQFPETTPRLRFLAPWSGGGNVIVKFASKIKEDGSRKG